MTDDELTAAIAAVPYFYHQIELRPGIVTPGWAPQDAAIYGVPDSLAGESVLDIGAWDGYWTFEALKRGATYAVAVDDHSDTIGGITNADRSSQWQTFDLCRAALGYTPTNCTRYTGSVYDIDRMFRGQFDRVFCFGVLYHLKHPLLALEKLRSVCKGTIHIETAILDNCQSAYGDYGYSGEECLFEFYPGSEYGLNASNWHVGTLKAWKAMVEAAGFRDVEAWKMTDSPNHVCEARGFLRARV